MDALTPASLDGDVATAPDVSARAVPMVSGPLVAPATIGGAVSIAPAAAESGRSAALAAQASVKTVSGASASSEERDIGRVGGS